MENKSLDREPLRKHLTPRVKIKNISVKKARWYTIKEGSQFESIISLLATAIGIACLTLPYASKQSGFLIGVGFVILGAFVSAWTLDRMIEYGFRNQIFRFSDMVTACSGHTAGVVFQWSLIMYSIGSVLNNLVTGESIIQSALVQFGLSKEDVVRPEYVQIILVAMLCITYPISCIKNLHGLRHVSVMAVVAVGLSMLLIVVECPMYMNKNFSSDKFVWVNFNQNILSTFSITVFGYNYHTNVVPVMAVLREPSEKKMKKISHIAIFGDALLFTMIAACGYLSTLNDTPQIVLLRTPISPAADWAMLVIKLMCAMYCLLNIPLRLNPCRSQVLIYFHKEKLNDRWHHRAFVTFCLLIPTSLVAYLIPDIYTSYTLVSGPSRVLIGLIFPGMLGLSMMKPGSWSKNFTLFIIIVLSSCGIGGALIKSLQLLGIVPS